MMFYRLLCYYFVNMRNIFKVVNTWLYYSVFNNKPVKMLKITAAIHQLQINDVDINCEIYNVYRFFCILGSLVNMPAQETTRCVSNDFIPEIGRHGCEN